jgi:hypothetical protein
VRVFHCCIGDGKLEPLLVGVRGQCDILHRLCQANELLNLDLDIQIDGAQGANSKWLVQKFCMTLISVACLRVTDTEITGMQLLRLEPYLDGWRRRTHVPVKVALDIAGTELTGEVADR